MTNPSSNATFQTVSPVNLCWYVGAQPKGVGDRTNEFIKRGLWINGHEKNNILTQVKSIKVGDKIAIKAACTKARDLPFDTNNEDVSLMYIKAVGTVTGNQGDGIHLTVQWDRPFDKPLCWYFFTNRTTVWKVERNDNDWRYGALLDFTFHAQPQDYNRFLDERKKKYSYTDKPATMIKEDSPLAYPQVYQKYITQLLHGYNLVLTGAPGTGKTYLAHKIAEALGAETDFVQFHPSYDYTDFVEGLRPVDTDESGNIKFARLDGSFKAFCKHALNNLNESRKSKTQIEEELSIEDKIGEFLDDAISNRTVLKTVTGTTFIILARTDTDIHIHADNDIVSKLIVKVSSIKELLMQQVKLSAVKDIRTYYGRKHAAQQDSYIYVIVKQIRRMKTRNLFDYPAETVKEKKFVFIIDEINRGELSKIFGELFFAIDKGYRKEKHPIKTQYQNLVDEDDVFRDGFYVPSNVYILATMNDIDRSVDSLDFAMRRRFSWMEVTADDSTRMMQLKDNVVATMRRVNRAIRHTDGLGRYYELGGAYFLDDMSDADRWDIHIKGLIQDYLRGIDRDGSKFETIKKAYFSNDENE